MNSEVFFDGTVQIWWELWHWLGCLNGIFIQEMLLAAVSVDFLIHLFFDYGHKSAYLFLIF